MGDNYELSKVRGAMRQGRVVQGTNVLGHIGRGPIVMASKKACVVQYVGTCVSRTMTNANCSTKPSLYTSAEITERMLCASASGEDSCSGDSGGPLVVSRSLHSSGGRLW